MADLVKAEVRSVRDLKHGVARFAEELRAAASGIRREAASEERRTREAVDQRKVQLRKAEAEFQRAEDALAHCEEDQRRECGQAVREAQQRASVSRRRLAAAAAAAEGQASSALHELLRVAALAEAAVADQSSAATSALLELEVKLSEITTCGAAAVAKSALVTFGIAAQVVGTAADVAKLAGNVSQGALPTAERIASTSQMQEWADDRDEQIWAEAEFDRRKRDAGRLVEGDETK